jgi:hypothetical protein
MPVNATYNAGTANLNFDMPTHNFYESPQKNVDFSNLGKASVHIK